MDLPKTSLIVLAIALAGCLAEPPPASSVDPQWVTPAHTARVELAPDPPLSPSINATPLDDGSVRLVIVGQASNLVRAANDSWVENVSLDEATGRLHIVAASKTSDVMHERQTPIFTVTVSGLRPGNYSVDAYVRADYCTDTCWEQWSTNMTANFTR